jgi:hypothetical protein
MKVRAMTVVACDVKLGMDVDELAGACKLAREAGLRNVRRVTIGWGGQVRSVTFVERLVAR